MADAGTAQELYEFVDRETREGHLSRSIGGAILSRLDRLLAAGVTLPAEPGAPHDGFHPIIGAIAGMQGYVNGLTLDTATGESWSGLTESDSVPGSIESSGDWLQRGPLIHAIRQVLASQPVPASVPEAAPGLLGWQIQAHVQFLMDRHYHEVYEDGSNGADHLEPIRAALAATPPAHDCRCLCHDDAFTDGTVPPEAVL